MKNLKKMLAVVTAISAMLASVPAFAALDLSEKDAVIDTFTCTGEDTTSPSVTASVAANAVDGGEMTFLILNDGAVVQNIQAEDILYIDQHSSSAGTSFTGVINLARVGENLSALPVGDYPVRIGYNSKTTGEFAIAEATLKVEEDSTGGTTVKLVFGDVNDGVYTGEASAVLDRVDAADAFAILNLAVGGSTSVGGVFDIGTVFTDTTGKKLVFGDVNDGVYTGEASAVLDRVDAADAFAILNLAVGGSTSVGGAYDIGTVVSTVVND